MQRWQKMITLTDLHFLADKKAERMAKLIGTLTLHYQRRCSTANFQDPACMLLLGKNCSYSLAAIMVLDTKKNSCWRMVSILSLMQHLQLKLVPGRTLIVPTAASHSCITLAAIEEE